MPGESELSGSQALSSALDDATRRLAAAGISTASLDAQLLLASALRSDRALLLAGAVNLSPQALSDFDTILARRITREPLAYILGHREFYSLDFEVTRDVLIPRPQTETLVEVALRCIGNRPVRALDIGTGSGAITVAIAVNASNAEIVATDISSAALEVARRNAARNKVTDRVRFVCSPVFPPDGGTFDIVVSNPPYIVHDEIDLLEPEVRDFEPRIALDGGPDGLDFYRRIAADAPQRLVAGGLLALEVGAGQDRAVREILDRAGMRDIECTKDLDGIPRVVTARR
jgi:release factor glutamine methyltransferase